MKEFLLAFIPIFIAVDAVGVLPIFVSLTSGLEKHEQKRIIGQSILTALSVAISFIFLGKLIFGFLGITIADFLVAGGVILFCIAIMDILFPEQRKSNHPQELGAVPIGTPLIVGPAVLTTSLIIVDQHGTFITLMAVIINILLAGVVFSFSDLLIRVFGHTGSRALSKVMALLLAAIAIMMIRKGIFAILAL